MKDIKTNARTGDPERSNIDDRGIVSLNEFALHRISHSLVRVFLHDWSAFHTWTLETTSDAGWSLCIDHDARSVHVSEQVFETRDAARAFVLFALLIAGNPGATSSGIQHRVRTMVSVARSLDRGDVAGYLNDIADGIKNGDVSFEQGTLLWVFTTLEWIRPASAVDASDHYDRLFDDSLLFSEIKKMLDQESA